MIFPDSFCQKENRKIFSYNQFEKIDQVKVVCRAFQKNKNTKHKDFTFKIKIYCTDLCKKEVESFERIPFNGIRITPTPSEPDDFSCVS